MRKPSKQAAPAPAPAPVDAFAIARELLAELPAGPGVVCADLDMIRLAELRQRFPTVAHRREL